MTSPSTGTVLQMDAAAGPQGMDCVSGALPVVPETLDLATLSRLVEAQQQIVDSRLQRAAKWRGETRREAHGHAQSGDHDRYESAYNELVGAQLSRECAIDASMLRRIHRAVAGGGEFRKTGLVVGGHYNFPTAGEVPSLLERSLTRAASGVEPVTTAATRLHLDVIAIHPFPDGNGRTARLAATLMLARAGFKSTLLVAVEQHCLPEPHKYLDVLDQYQYGEIDDDACVAHLMSGMAVNAMYAAWFRAREVRLRDYAERAGLTGPAVEQALMAYDFRRGQNRRNTAFREIFGELETPLHRVIDTLTSSQRTEMSFQIQRLLDEEVDDQAMPPAIASVGCKNGTA